ncbi:GntR family transcriptional regulator [Rhodococcus sp. NPDC003318]|uniref:GntR family transcriptional regulator n=1 Tax=Rhodococcus sp. NPDC003318 TaxID=3364503 RepID=UPI0036767760
MVDSHTPDSGASVVPGADAEFPRSLDGRRVRADDARRFADLLRRQVHDGVFVDGALPSETKLAAEFHVSRNAVREGLDILRAENLIVRAPKVGTRVSGRRFEHGLDALVGLKETLRDYGTVRNEVRVVTEIEPPPTVARRLELDPGAPVVYIERVRYLGDLPLSLDLTYLVPDIGSQVAKRDLVHNDIFALIETVAGEPLGSASVAVEAVSADAHSAANLHAPEGAALLLLERLTRLESGRPVDLEYIRMRGDRMTLRGNLSRDSGAFPEWKVQ